MPASNLISLGVGSPSSVGALVLFGLFNGVESELGGTLPEDILVTEAAYVDVDRLVTSQFRRTVGYTDVARTIAVG